MLTHPSPGRRTRRIVFGLALLSAAPLGMVRAQYPAGAVVQSLPNADDPAERLATALRTLAVSPDNLAALIAAGKNALILGDPNAAVGFFAHASEIAPRDGRVQAGLGGALVALEKPQEALRYFQQASVLGVADVDLAEDRGLAYDLVGDPARAQRDYQTVLAARPDDDATRRRLALSQGISGNRAGAIATLDPLIRKRDIAAWRAQTFVLAMTGDAKGANDITRIMLPSQQAMLQPFLVRLAALSAADKARAVHFGEMPTAGRGSRGPQLAVPSDAQSPVATANAMPARARAPQVVAPVTNPAPQRLPQTVPTPHAETAIAPTPPVVATGTPAMSADRTATPAAAAFVPPVRVAAADGATHFVANGVPMRRIEHSAQEIFALGMPRYEYIPVGGSARPLAAPRPAPSATIAAAPPSSAVSAPLPAIAVATQTAAAAPPSVPAVMPVVSSAGPSALPVTGAPPDAGALAMPLGSSAMAGHYDLPHASGSPRVVPRNVQPTARPPASLASAKPDTSPAPAMVVRPAAAPVVSESALVNPTVAAARRVHATMAPVAIASSDRTVRHGRTRAETASPAEADAVVSDKSAARGKTAAARSGRRAASDDAIDTKPSGGKGKDRPARDHDEDKSGGRTGKRTGSPDDDAGSSKRRGRSAKADTPATPRVYVQVAGGANKSDMDKAWASVKAKAPDLMKGQKPSTTPLHATNRLLVGPFKSDDEAQAFVNKMAGKGLSGFTFKSGKGQKIDTVGKGGKGDKADKSDADR